MLQRLPRRQRFRGSNTSSLSIRSAHPGPASYAPVVKCSLTRLGWSPNACWPGTSGLGSGRPLGSASFTLAAHPQPGKDCSLGLPHSFAMSSNWLIPRYLEQRPSHHHFGQKYSLRPTCRSVVRTFSPPPAARVGDTAGLRPCWCIGGYRRSSLYRSSFGPGARYGRARPKSAICSGRCC